MIGLPSMKLFITPNSPYARKARVVARELAISHHIEEVRVALRTSESELLGYSPVGRVPALWTSERLFTECSFVCEYMDSMHDGPKLFGSGGEARWALLEQEGRAIGFLDGLAFSVREFRRPPSTHSQHLLEVERIRANRCLDVLEAEAASQSWDDTFLLPRLTVACALGLADFALPALDWRRRAPTLGAWFELFASRASMVATAPEVSALAPRARP